MSITLTGVGGWGTRMGHFINSYNLADVYRGAALDVQVSSIFGEYLSNDQIAIDTLFRDRDSYRNVHTTWLGAVQRMASTTTVEQINREEGPLPTKSINTALVTLIDYLKTNDLMVVRSTLTPTITVGPENSGDATLVVSTVDPYDGGTFDYALSETYDVIVTSDAASGATAFSEQAQAAGDPTRGSMEYNWPGGAGATNVSIGAIDGERATLVTGAFETWTAAGFGGSPSGWTVMCGNASVQRSSVAPLRGTYNLQMDTAEDPGEDTRIRSGALSLTARTAYRLGVYAKVNAVVTPGTLVIKLVDQAGDTIADEAGVANERSITMNGGAGMTTDYQLFYAFFRTPRIMPTTVYLDIHLTVPPATTVIDIDCLSFGLAQQLYQGGPYVAIFSGATALSRGDRWTLQIANSYTSSSFNRGLERMFGLRQLGFKFPSTTGSPPAALLDGLVV